MNVFPLPIPLSVELYKYEMIKNITTLPVITFAYRCGGDRALLIDEKTTTFIKNKKNKTMPIIVKSTLIIWICSEFIRAVGK